MESFSLSQEDLLFLSVTANAMFLLYLLVNRLVELTVYLLRGRCWLATYMGEINRTRPGLVGRVLFEHLVLWGLVILVVICLKYTSVTTYPFLHPFPYSPSERLAKIVLYISITRSTFLAGRLALSRDIHVLQDHAKSRISVGPTGNTKADLTYSVLDAGAKFVCLAFGENLFLGVTSSFFELNSTTLDFYRVMELFRMNVSSRALHNALVLNVITCVLCRAVLPIVFLLLALLNQSPLVMDTVPVVWFFLGALFHFILHGHSIYQSTLLLVRPLPEILPLPHSCRPSQSGPPVLNALSNDIHEGGSASTAGKTREGFPLFKSFNYIFMRSYDNRNLACVFGNEGSEKVNILKRKDISKTSLLYKPRRGEESTFHDKALPAGTKDELDNQLEPELATEESLLNSPLDNFRVEAGSIDFGTAEPTNRSSDAFVLDVEEYEESSSHSDS